jgi:hypothetical protein
VPFRSRLREIIRGRSEEREALAVEMYARGLSTRDIEALFADDRGQSLRDALWSCSLFLSFLIVFCSIPGLAVVYAPHVPGLWVICAAFA